MVEIPEIFLFSRSESPHINSENATSESLTQTSCYAFLGDTVVNCWIECSSTRITLVLLLWMVRTVSR